MRTADVYARQIRSVSDLLFRLVEDLGPRLAERPGPALNPAGFIYWHILRVWDHDLREVHGLAPPEDIWHREGFTLESGYEPVATQASDGETYADGYGYTDANVDAVPYRADWLARYHRLLLDNTLAWLSTVDDDALVRSIRLPYRDEPTSPGEILEHSISHSAYHNGELQMTLGLLGIPDPSTPARVTSDGRVTSDQ